LLIRTGHKIGTQTAGAGVDVAGSAFHDRLDALYIRFPGPIASAVGVGNPDPKADAFAADVAFCHSLHLLTYKTGNIAILSDNTVHCNTFSP